MDPRRMIGVGCTGLLAPSPNRMFKLPICRHREHSHGNLLDVYGCLWALIIASAIEDGQTLWNLKHPQPLQPSPATD
ncbi:hypothetical protein SERLADRAFT_444212 [Serpula lacrymans var. lacrymans S7.9]|uniref:Uncharacterized protein n=1 Tax=Serpula lacrymans var. lacrymans (strain S7.9) TaxID=578457 RepID=F8PES6_SERL9|nr:uncharacterized protein SERLADRAFT_444212 [Serpula lacrymans var. lacrymans S7.9]EGO18372.1 hypothetical protein SERLADRAFT_444212 [Serpula lacrymans var. lacrymans S7.9]